MALLEMNNREELIPIFSEFFAKLPRESEQKDIEGGFLKLLQAEFGYSADQSRRFLHEVTHSDRQMHKLNATPLKERFKNVTQRRPVQGGSPGLGKGKS